MKKAFTMAGAGQRAPLFGWLAYGHVAFTMAEILLSLTIIGVVAAITLPSLTGNINERTWNTQKKALYARMSQAISLMPALNGYGTLNDTTDTAAETFVTSGLSKVLKINNICDNEHFSDCGFPEQMLPLSGTKFSTPKTLEALNNTFTGVEHGGMTYSALDTKAVAFETANGESIIAYYNPRCTSFLHETETSFTQSLMCVNFVYDLNNKKGPNTIGKDQGFITVLSPSDSSVVAPEFYHRDQEGVFTWSEAISECKSLGDEYRLPNRDEATAMYYNKKLLGNIGTSTGVVGFWTATVYDTDHAWEQGFGTGKRYILSKTREQCVRCIKR